jgi:hypothetical protein
LDIGRIRVAATTTTKMIMVKGTLVRGQIGRQMLNTIVCGVLGCGQWSARSPDVLAVGDDSDADVAFK